MIGVETAALERSGDEWVGGVAGEVILVAVGEVDGIEAGV